MRRRAVTRRPATPRRHRAARHRRRPRPGGDVGDAPQNLRQDHPGVAPGTVEGTRRQCAGDSGDVTFAGFGTCLGQRRSHGEQHVGAGVGIGDREDVEAVDLVDMGDQVAHRGVRPITQRSRIQQAVRRTCFAACLEAHLTLTSRCRLRGRQPIQCRRQRRRRGWRVVHALGAAGWSPCAGHSAESPPAAGHAFCPALSDSRALSRVGGHPRHTRATVSR